MSDDIWRWTAVRIAAAIRGRDISAKEALESCLGRMGADMVEALPGADRSGQPIVCP
jgi:hypothetical protein